MKPFEQIKKYTYVNLWHLLPFVYVCVNEFDTSELALALLPLLIMQCSITSGLLLWAFREFEQKTVRETWIWIQAFVTSIILWMSISELVALSNWLSITLHITLPIVCFIAFYKMLIVGFKVPPMRDRTLEDPQSNSFEQ